MQPFRSSYFNEFQRIVVTNNGPTVNSTTIFLNFYYLNIIKMLLNYGGRVCKAAGLRQMAESTLTVKKLHHFCL